MRDLRLRGLWLGLGMGLVASVVVASLLPMPELPVQASDKLLHVLAYASMSAWFGCVVLQRWYWALFVAFSALGITIEILQGMTSFRSFEVHDLLADGIGIVLGLGISATPLGDSLRWLERHTGFA
jgi:VanZ family protein